MKTFYLLTLCLAFCFTVRGFDDARMNKILGFPLFSSKTWQESPQEIGKRLHIRFQTTMIRETPQYSAYMQGKCLGVPLHQLSIHNDSNGDIVSVTLLMTNKGDTLIRDEDDFKKQFKKDYRTVLARLEKAFGTTKKRQDICRWVYSDTVITLTAPKNEYISVEISRKGAQPLGTEHEQRSMRRREIKAKDFSVNVEKNNFGDCFIRNVPMVDQGSKGYCGPATIARCLLYYGIMDYDMQELAKIFETGNGGGTVLNTLTDEAEKIFHRYGISVKKRNLKLRTVKEAINKGNLIVWTQVFDEDAETRIDNNTVQRTAMKPEKWRTVIARQKRLKKGRLAHLRLIIGYNEKTDELAISDSWGDSHKLRWIPCADAEKIVYDSIILLEP